MNVYDFDKTIYPTDSTTQFYFYCIRKRPIILKKLPRQFAGFFKYFIKKIDKTQMKENFYCFLQDIKDIDVLCKSFWERNEKNINKWYLEKQKKDDVIISASPEFLLEPICKRLKIKYLYASRVDKKTGKYTGINCHGEEKVRRYKEAFDSFPIDEFYSDSYSDTPLALLAKKSFLVKGDKLSDWDFSKS